MPSPAAQTSSRRSAETNLKGSPAPNTDVRDTVGADAFGALLDAVTACVTAGLCAPDDPVLIAHRVWVGLHGQDTLQASMPWHPWPQVNAFTAGLVELLADLATRSQA